MNKETFLKIFYVCISILLITLTLGGVIGSIVSVCDYVHAEELTDNAILNFNQLVDYNSNNTTYKNLTATFNGSNITINGNSTSGTGYEWRLGKDFSMIENHKYYVNFVGNQDITNLGRYRIYYAYTSLYYDSVGTAIYTSSYSGIVSIGMAIYGNVNFNNFVLSINVIDLTQMFGDGNEPTTIEQVKSYLPLNYYSYQVGTPVSYSYLKGKADGFNDGVLSVIESYDYSILSESLIKSAISINYMGENSNISFYFGDNRQLMTFYNMVRIPLGVLIDKGEQINFKCDITLMTEGVLTIGYLESGYFIPLTEYFTNGNVNVDIVAPTELNSIYLMCDTGEDTYSPQQATIVLPEITLKVLDYEKLNLLAFQNGLDSANTNSYYNQGFEDGKKWYINHNTETAWGSSWDFISTSFNGIGEIMSLQILPNVPLWTFIAIPLLLGLITFIYKLKGD